MEDQLQKLIRTRRCVRAFGQEAISDRDLAQILNAGTWAPNAGNVQPWHFFIARDPDTKNQLVEAALGQSFIAQAPMIIIVCADLDRARNSYKKRGETLYCLQDTAAAIQNMMLMAHALGLGSCWVGAFDEMSVSSQLGIPPRFRPVALVPIGKAAEVPRDPGRKPLSEVCSELD